MKRMIPLLICLLLLCGCASQETVKEVNIGEKVFTVDTQAQTIHDGTYTYSYEASGRNVEIIYPNGAWYYYASTGVQGGVSWSNDYDSSPISKYADGQHLVEAVVQATERKQIPALNLVLGVVLIGMGTVHVIWPGAVWKLRYSIWVKDAEPTDFALGFSRVVGAICIVAGIAAFFLW